MSRLALTMLMLCSTAALAQHSRKAPPPDSAGKPSMPLPDSTRTRLTFRTYVEGWRLTGSKVESYEVRCDEVVSSCHVPILRTRIGAEEPLGTASLTHAESALVWRGARVELKAELRAGRIGGWAGLWMRIDGPDGEVLAFDNMQNRPLQGTTPFNWYSVVLDVPPNAERITFGVMLRGPGAVWVRELQFDEAEPTAASTDLLGPLRQENVSLKR